MNLRSSTHVLLLTLSLGVVACGAPDAASAGPAEPAQPEVSRELAVTTARADAAAHFQALATSATAAHQTGPFWIVELRTANGTGLRYAISRQDGSIRQRANFQ